MWIQLLLLLGIAATVIPLTRSAGARHQAIRRLLLGGFVLLAVFAVLFPSVLTSVANALGVGRGTDLLLYMLVIAFLTYVSSSYRRLTGLNQKLTVLARELALTRAALERTGARGDALDGDGAGGDGDGAVAGDGVVRPDHGAVRPDRQGAVRPDGRATG
ncbi:DUF2304 domain-containing protein [Georgenia yuyongxinii]|uniref:DUF2304 domain-containing protein n=1 Tax=Georgenia yuyongxinii TaxID=2589797 RepID=A0A5B8C551_9MICO|nr:DUF2304 domain-containing protein [Georgenia yuyongxinii]QDC25723.1 DUF2304 domain-containing protein [Georgenia yuyongxinii]